MTPNVVAVKANPKNEKQGFVKFDDNTEAWTPELAMVKDLPGKPLPEGWTLKDGPYGKQMLPPKDKSGKGAAWGNTEAGERFVQERMDRRTALMQSIAFHDGQSTGDVVRHSAQLFYEWLRVPASGNVAAGAEGSDTLSRPSVPESPPVTERVNGEESDTVAGGSTSESKIVAQGPMKRAADAAAPDSDPTLTGEGERLTGKRANSNSPVNDSTAVHVHGPWVDHWTDDTGREQKMRDGWLMCATCRRSEPAKKVSA